MPRIKHQTLLDLSALAELTQWWDEHRGALRALLSPQSQTPLTPDELATLRQIIEWWRSGRSNGEHFTNKI